MNTSDIFKAGDRVSVFIGGDNVIPLDGVVVSIDSYGLTLDTRPGRNSGKPHIELYPWHNIFGLYPAEDEDQPARRVHNSRNAVAR